jgi:two-component system CheB/CheR fusion protein
MRVQTRDSCAGASAGGLNAFRAFFSVMPADSGMPFVVVQHLFPDHQRMLAEIPRETLK